MDSCSISSYSSNPIWTTFIVQTDCLQGKHTKKPNNIISTYLAETFVKHPVYGMDGWWALSRETCRRIDSCWECEGDWGREWGRVVVVPMRGTVGSRLGGLKSVTDYQTGRLVVWLRLRGVKEKGRRRITMEKGNAATENWIKGEPSDF